MSDRLDLLLGVADAGGDHCAAERMCASFHDEAAGREMIGKRIMHDVPAPESGGKKRPRGCPEIAAVAFRLENGTWRHQNAAQGCRWSDIEPAEGRMRALMRRQVGFAEQRQFRQRRPGIHLRRIDSA